MLPGIGLSGKQAAKKDNPPLKIAHLFYIQRSMIELSK